MQEQAGSRVSTHFEAGVQAVHVVRRKAKKSAFFIKKRVVESIKSLPEKSLLVLGVIFQAGFR